MPSMMDGWKRTEHTAGPWLAPSPTAFARPQAEELCQNPTSHSRTVWLADNAVETPQISARAQVQDLVLSVWEPLASSGAPHTDPSNALAGIFPSSPEPSLFPRIWKHQDLSAALYSDHRLPWSAQLLGCEPPILTTYLWTSHPTGSLMGFCLNLS